MSPRLLSEKNIPGKEKSRNIYLHPALENALERESRRYGVKRRVVAAALWLFTRSDSALKDMAIEAAVFLEEGGDDETPEEQVERLKAQLEAAKKALQEARSAANAHPKKGG